MQKIYGYQIMKGTTFSNANSLFKSFLGNAFHAFIRSYS